MTKQIHANTPESFKFCKEITRNFGEIEPVLEWCKTSLIDDDWRWQPAEIASQYNPGRYLFYFNNDMDFMTFVLKYS